MDSVKLESSGGFQIFEEGKMGGLPAPPFFDWGMNLIESCRQLFSMSSGGEEEHMDAWIRRWNGGCTSQRHGLLLDVETKLYHLSFTPTLIFGVVQFRQVDQIKLIIYQTMAKQFAWMTLDLGRCAIGLVEFGFLLVEVLSSRRDGTQRKCYAIVPVCH